MEEKAENGTTMEGDENPPVKSAKQLEKEAKKAAKLEKLKMKQDRQAAAPPQSEAPAQVTI